MLTVDGKLHGAGEKQAVIGTYGETDRQRITIHRHNGHVDGEGAWRQVNREGNSLINELIIGTGSKDLFSVSDPDKDAQFASFFLDPLLAHLYSSILDIPIPPAPRTDLLLLVQYMAPICPGCGPNDAGPDRGPAAAEYWYPSDSRGQPEASWLPGRRSCRIPAGTAADR